MSITDLTVNISSVSKRFGSSLALDDISLHVNKGETYGLIGPDGAGKTTLLRILATLLLPDEGKVSVCGFDAQRNLKAVRSAVGYVPGHFSLYPDLTVKENLKFHASLFGTEPEECYNIIAPVYERLKPFENRLAGNLSGGMKQKLALSCALIHRPLLLLLDEPTTGVDAVSRREFWDVLGTLRKDGITIVVSTPYMDEAERCDRISLMNEGRIMCTGTVNELKSSFSNVVYSVSAYNMYKLLIYLRTMPHVIGCYPFGTTHHMYTDTELDIEKCINDICKHGFTDVHLRKTEPSIEDLFITLMQCRTIK